MTPQGITPEDYRRAGELFDQLRDLPEAERTGVLDAACSGHFALRAQVLRLLAADDQAAEGAFLERRALDDASRLLKPQLPPNLAPGTVLGNYRLGSRIGAGGMGVVYEAQDLRLHRRVALKVLALPMAAEGSDGIKRFRQEARAASLLAHPNIIPIFDADFDQGYYYIAMEFVEGKTLRQMMGAEATSMDSRLVLDLVAQIASALSAAHSAGIVHRDIKPENIMVRPDGFVKVLDFGLAKQAESPTPVAGVSAVNTRPGHLAGTIQYLSPEQVVGKPVDARSDLFSLGVVAYELATGSRPFEGPTDGAVFDAILHHIPALPSTVRPELGAEFDSLVQRALEKDRDLRFQTAGDVSSACKRLGRDSLTPVALSQPPPPVRSRRWIAWAVAAVVAAIATYVFVAGHPRGPVVPETVVAVTTYPAWEMYPAFSPDGRQVAFYWDGDSGVNPGIYVTFVGESNALRLTTGLDSYPAWLPDGKRIAFGRAGSNPGIYSVSGLGGTERKLSDLAPSSQIVVSPDGNYLALSIDSEKDRGILLLPIDGGEPLPISNPKAPRFDRAPAFSPDGRQLAYAACTSNYACDIHVQALDARYAPQGSSRSIAPQEASISGVVWSRDGRSLLFTASRMAAILPYLWQIDLDGRNPPRRLEIAGPNAWYPSFSPTGNRLLFQRNFGAEDIWRYDANGMEPFVVSSLATNRNPRFSPNGERIAFESSRSGQGEIWVVRADGSQPVQLTNRLGRHQGTPRWSPDGQWIAFDSQGPDGHWDIYVIDASGGSPRRVTSDAADEAMPFWSHDQKWIYFRTDRTGRHEIWRIPFAGGGQEQVTTGGGSAGFESVDGEMLLYTKAAMSGSLFARRLAGGEETELIPYIHFKAFAPVSDGIYYIGSRRDDGYYPLEFYQFSSRISRVLAKIQGRAYQGLAVSPDRKTILFCKLGSLGADVMMIENFQ